MDKLKSSTAMPKFCCITDIIRFMVNEAEKLMKGSVHEDDFFVVRDALVLMTAKETINRMRKKGYLHIWLLPLNILQGGDPYSGRPVVNSPDFMPLDKYLNREILHSLLMHMFLIRYILNGEETNE